MIPFAWQRRLALAAPRWRAGVADLFLEQLPERGHALLQHLLVVQVPQGGHRLPSNHRHQHAVLLLDARKGKAVYTFCFGKMFSSKEMESLSPIKFHYFLLSPIKGTICFPHKNSLFTYAFCYCSLLKRLKQQHKDQIQGSLGFSLIRTCFRSVTRLCRKG